MVPTHHVIVTCRLLIKDKIFGEQKEEDEKDSELIDPLPNKLKTCVVSSLF